MQTNFFLANLINTIEELKFERASLGFKTLDLAAYTNLAMSYKNYRMHLDLSSLTVMGIH